MPANFVNQFPSIQQMTGQITRPDTKNTSSAQLSKNGTSFAQILNEKTAQSTGLKFSKHANMRMQTRNIDLSEEQWGRLESGVAKAGLKGIRESLVMVDDLAFIVNVSSNTVITAVGEGDDKIFTNIDGAVIA